MACGWAAAVRTIARGGRRPQTDSRGAEEERVGQQLPQAVVNVVIVPVVILHGLDRHWLHQAEMSLVSVRRGQVPPVPLQCQYEERPRAIPRWSRADALLYTARVSSVFCCRGRPRSLTAWATVGAAMRCYISNACVI